MAILLCPVCGKPLFSEKTGFFCENKHCFDRARQGYVNLLPVTQKHSLHPGDTQRQVADRRAFLDGGWYGPIAETLTELLREEAPAALLDAGCGEGYYLSRIREALPEAELWGLDISRDAVRLASGREKKASFLVATAAHTPFPDESFDCVISLFALTAAEEFRRILRRGGLFLQAVAHPEHLMGLKSIIYPRLLRREKHQGQPLEGFRLERTVPLDFTFTLPDASTVEALLGMTPHVYRIDRAGAERLRATTSLTDTARVLFHLYRAI